MTRAAGADVPHGHSHSHAAPPPPGLRGTRAVLAAALLLVVLTVVGVAALWPSGADRTTPFTPGERVRATVLGVEDVPCGGALAGDQGADPLVPATCAVVSARVDEGPERGLDVVIDADGTAYGDALRPGDGVVLLRAPQADVPDEERYAIADRQRGGPLLLLGLAFAAAVVAFGRLRGLTALLGLAASALVLTQFLLPALLDGGPPVLVAAVGASAVMCLVLPLSHGLGVRTATALLGTAAALLLIVGLSALTVTATGLSGLASEEAQFVSTVFGDLDLRGLLLAGVVVGSLGILDDVTVTQVSTVWELRSADPSSSRRALFARALRVGRDHVAATVNTLLLAYAGASLPLLVVFSTSGQPVVDVITDQLVAEEVVRALVGSIGIVAAVPLTTALAALTAPGER